MQYELSTFYAGSCPVAVNIPATIFVVRTPKPLIEPAIADLIKFLTHLILLIWQRWFLIFLYCITGNYCFGDNLFTTHFNPTNSRRFLFRTIISTDRYYMRIREILFIADIISLQHLRSYSFPLHHLLRLRI